jgi:hypothetical protein
VVVFQALKLLEALASDGAIVPNSLYLFEKDMWASARREGREVFQLSLLFAKKRKWQRSKGRALVAYVGCCSS